MASKNDSAKKQKTPSSGNIKKIVSLSCKLFFIIAFGSLFLTAYASDTKTVSRIQYLLSLKGYNLNYRDSDGIDGKLGSKTLRAISEYKETLPIGIRNTVDLIDLKKILENDIKLGNTQTRIDESEKNFKELKDEFYTTKTELNKFITKQNEKEKEYTKDIGLVNIGTTLILSILGILLALMGLFGAGAYKIMKNSLESALEHEKRCIGIDVMTRVFSYLSEAFYLYYREFFKDPGPEFLSAVDLALSFTDRALFYANLLEKEKPSKTSEALLINAKSHKAYHLASRKNPEDIDECLNMIKEIEEYSEKLLQNGDIEHWVNFTDTVAWVYIRSGNPSNQEKGQDIINKLLRNRYIHQKIKKDIYNNYLKSDETASAWIAPP